MQTGDAHQVIDASTREHQPLRRGDAVLVADRQRAQYAGIRRTAKRGVKLVAHRFAPGFDAVAEAGGQCVNSLIIPFVVHVTHCAQVAFQRPGFEIETVRVCRTVRLLEAQREPPALPGF